MISCTRDHYQPDSWTSWWARVARTEQRSAGDPVHRPRSAPRFGISGTAGRLAIDYDHRCSSTCDRRRLRQRGDSRGRAPAAERNPTGAGRARRTITACRVVLAGVPRRTRRHGPPHEGHPCPERRRVELGRMEQRSIDRVRGGGGRAGRRAEGTPGGQTDKDPNSGEPDNDHRRPDRPPIWLVTSLLQGHQAGFAEGWHREVQAFNSSADRGEPNGASGYPERRRSPPPVPSRPRSIRSKTTWSAPAPHRGRWYEPSTPGRALDAVFERHAAAPSRSFLMPARRPEAVRPQQSREHPRVPRERDDTSGSTSEERPRGQRSDRNLFICPAVYAAMSC